MAVAIFVENSDGLYRGWNPNTDRQASRMWLGGGCSWDFYRCVQQIFRLWITMWVCCQL